MWIPPKEKKSTLIMGKQQQSFLYYLPYKAAPTKQNTKPWNGGIKKKRNVYLWTFMPLLWLEGVEGGGDQRCKRQPNEIVFVSFRWIFITFKLSHHQHQSKGGSTLKGGGKGFHYQVTISPLWTILAVTL